MPAPAADNPTGCAPIRSVCVFCGSRPGNHPAFAEAAQKIGALLARQGRRIVYGGGHVGLMGILADSAMAHGGTVYGVIPAALQQRELGHRSITELHIVDTMHQRKALMAEQSDAFIALPGGVGTYEEILEIATWSLLGIQDKPLGLLNVHGFYDSLIQQLDTAAKYEFMLPDERALILDSTTPEDLLRQLAAFCRPGPPKWMDMDET
jgi:uncharacterized protein (TIGR00730 family)